MTVTTSKKRLVTLRVNGVEREVAVAPQAILLDVIRETLGLTGTKRGCDMGTCGCCTVTVDGEARLACLTLAAQVEGREVRTVESLAGENHVHPIQACFTEHGGSQCGFCTPGFIMATDALLRDNPDPTDAEIRDGISGNLCRCTGYVKIIEAVREAASRLRTAGDGRGEAVGEGWLPDPAPIAVKDLPKPKTHVRVAGRGATSGKEGE